VPPIAPARSKNLGIADINPVGDWIIQCE